MSSPYPPSFAGNSWLYGFSLASLMAIGVFGLIVAGWMMRDLWRDRFTDHPTSLLFCFRVMQMLAGAAGFLRCLPEVAYMTCYGDPKISPEAIALILSVKRTADSLSLPVVVSWMTILVLIYPFVVLVLRSYPAREIRVDPLSFWPRLVRPLIILAVVIAISALMAIAKGYGLRP